MIRILGIDPGYAIVGFGILDYDGFRFRPIEYGAITTDAGTPFPDRLNAIFTDAEFIFDRYKPDCMAIERLYFTSNQKTAIDVAQARGVTVLSAARRNIPISEYTPLQVKQSVVGYGKAEKKQVMEMTRSILGLAQIPKPDDAADALAIAICHGHSTRFDFRTAKTIGRDIHADDEQIRNGGGYDHNFVLRERTEIEPAAILESEKSGIRMEVSTDLPGMQLYTANSTEMTGKNSTQYKPFCGVCFETQYFPDSIHHPNFPDCVLKAGREAETVTVFHFA